MISRAIRNSVALTALLFSFTSLATPQEKQIKKAPIQRTSAASGAEMYKEYCAVCHGKAGKGDGPAASALKVPPPDLTTLAKRHDGKFPDPYVVTLLKNGTEAAAHGTSEMPIWGPLFKSLKPMDNALVAQRISNVSNYLKSLQTK